jgi:hypothetical protein
MKLIKNKTVIYLGILLFLNLIILLSSCNYKNEEDISTFVLKGTTVKSNDSDFIPQIPVCLHDSILYMESSMRDVLVNAYLLKEDSLILYDRFLSKGTGPYEVTNFASVYDRETETLSLFENSGKLTKGYRINLKEKNRINDKATWKKFDFSKIKNARFGHGFVYVSDSLLLAIGGKYNNRELLTLINLNDCISTYPLDFWPDDGFEANLFVKQGIYIDNAKIFKNNKLNKYLYVSALGKYMEIFGLNNNQLTDRIPVCQTFIKYGVDNDNYYRTESNDINRGFRVYVTDSLIYASPIEFTLDMLRSGQTNREGYPCYYSKYLIKISFY